MVTIDVDYEYTYLSTRKYIMYLQKQMYTMIVMRRQTMEIAIPTMEKIRRGRDVLSAWRQYNVANKYNCSNMATQSVSISLFVYIVLTFLSNKSWCLLNRLHSNYWHSIKMIVLQSHNQVTNLYKWAHKDGEVGQVAAAADSDVI